MPKGIYKRTEYHKQITRKGIKKAYLDGSHPDMGFKKGHKDIVPVLSRKKQGEKMKMLLKGNTYAKDKHWKMSKKGKTNIGKAMKGIKHCNEARRKKSRIQSGNKSHFWKGGITPINEKIRKSIEYCLWREAVFARDNWTCQKYRTKGGKLHPHHIKNFAQYLELRFAIDNGITLSKKAHIEFHKKYGKKNNTKEQLDEFLYCGEKKLSEFDVPSLGK